MPYGPVPDTYAAFGSPLSGPWTPTRSPADSSTSGDTSLVIQVGLVATQAAWSPEATITVGANPRAPLLAALCPQGWGQPLSLGMLFMTLDMPDEGTC